MKDLNLKWKKDYGDGEETEDLVLWLNGKPTELIISEMSEGIKVLFNGRKELYYGGSYKECKEAFQDEFQGLVNNY